MAAGIVQQHIIQMNIMGMDVKYLGARACSYIQIAKRARENMAKVQT